MISDSQSLTSLIPSALGLFQLGMNKSLFMHLAVVVGLIMFIGGLDIIRTLLGNGTVFKKFGQSIKAFFIHSYKNLFATFRESK